MKKKYLALFLSTTLLASSFPATALAAHQVRSNKDVMWVFDGDTITAKGFPAEYNGDTVYMSYSEYDENWSGIPYTGHKFTAKVKNGQASFRLDGTEKDGLYKMLIYIFSYLAIINLATFIVYAVDKYKAIHEQWRISEATLMTMSAVGGSLGGLLAMYTFRHKTKKKKFTVGLPVMLSIQAVLVLLLLECVQL